MNKLKRLLIKINELYYNAGRKLLKTDTKKMAVALIIYFASFLIFMKYFSTNFDNEIIIICYIYIIILSVIIVICKCKDILLSVTGFLFSGIVYYLLIVICLYEMIKYIETDRIACMLIVYVSAALLWWNYSLLADNKVSSLANSVLSGFFGILVLVKDVVLELLSSTPYYGMESYINKIWNFIISPILAINIIAIVLCAIKGYWIDKYNDGKDIKDNGVEDKKTDDNIK